MKKENWRDFIINNVPIVPYIERYETLDQAGNEQVGSHSTHTSNSGRCLKVNAEKGTFNCFNCGAKGSVIDYEMCRLGGVGFAEACESLAEIRGLELPMGDWSPAEREAYQAKRKQDTDTLSLLNIAADYFHSQITPAVQAYYKDRGFTTETIVTEKLGYVPKKDGLKAVLHETIKGADLEASDLDIQQRILDTGLYLLNEDGTLKPVFRDRFIFPYWRTRQQIGYLIGRNAGKDTYTRDGATFPIPKYKKLNTKATDGKSELPVARYHTLWGAHLLQKDGNPIVITEGIVDALLFRQELGNRFQVVSPVTTRINSADIGRIIDRLWNWGDCYVTLIFCNDTETSGAGAGGALETAEKLQAEWESRINAEKTKCEEAKKETPARPRIMLKIATLPCPPERDKIDVADYIQLGRVSELEYWLDSAQNLWYHKAKESNDPSRFFDKKTFKPKLVADELRQQGRYFLNTSGWLYEYQGGVYRENENGIKADVQKMLWELSTPTHADNVVKHISQGCFVSEKDMTASDKINCLNGILDTETLELLPHSPYNKTLIQINAAWDAKAECPVIEKFLGQVLPADCQDLIHEVVGYTIQQSNQYEKAVFMVGAGSNGKSTFLNMVRSFIGSENYVAKSLHVLAENRFASASLFGKLANICGDIPASRLEDTSTFKQITSTDAVTGERKFKGSFEFDNFATNYFSCNELPPTRDRTYGFYRRWLVMPFRYQISENERDLSLPEKLKRPSELSGLLSLAVEGIRRLKKQRGFVVPESIKGALVDYQMENDSVLRFVADEVDIIDSEAVATRKEVYETYRAYCESQGVRPVSQIAFNKSLSKNEVATPLDKVRPRSWRGISVKDSEFHPDNLTFTRL